MKGRPWELVKCGRGWWKTADGRFEVFETVEPDVRKVKMAVNRAFVKTQWVEAGQWWEEDGVPHIMARRSDTVYVVYDFDYGLRRTVRTPEQARAFVRGRCKSHPPRLTAAGEPVSIGHATKNP